MKVELESGDGVDVTFKDIDGVITVVFSERAITVAASLPDSHARVGVLYAKELTQEPEEDLKDLLGSLDTLEECDRLITAVRLRREVVQDRVRGVMEEDEARTRIPPKQKR